MRTRSKICGITRPADGQKAAELGVDAIGLVFYAKSPRAVNTQKAVEIASVLPAFVSTVGLFVNPAPEEVQAALAEVPLDLLQFHGDESPAFCAQFKRPYIKAIRMRDDIDLAAELECYSASCGLLLDTYQPGLPGGTGESFDWQRIPENLASKIILAGGLNAENVAEAIKQVQPYAVDVSGGVEASKGIKDAEKMAAFMGEVERV